MALTKITKIVLFEASWPVSEMRNGDEVKFAEKADAEKVAKIPLGWYGSTGSVISKEYNETDTLPPYYESADEWAKEKLTVNQYEKFMK